MKPVQTALADLTRKLETHWHTWLTVELDTTRAAAAVPEAVAADVGGSGEGDTRAEAAAFPLVLPLGRLDGPTLAARFPEVDRDALEWGTFATQYGVEVRWENRSVHRTTQSVATHLVVTDLDQAATLAGAPWPDLLDTARRRRQRLTELFGPIPASLLRVVSGKTALSDVDFEMLCTTALWLRDNDPTGLTARQVPIEGVHGKWLNAHRRELQILSGRDSLGLVERASHVRYQYLDPKHLAGGGRTFDSHTVGDKSRPAYRPTVAVIAENKDTALLFPKIPDAISVFGNGYAAVAQLPQVPWLREIPQLVYWGDIDAEAFEIVHGLRSAGLDVRTILMDVDTYERYERYGSPTDAAGKEIKARVIRPLGHLTAAERQLYDRLVDPSWTRVRRIEQERIPFTHALDALARVPAEAPGPDVLPRHVGRVRAAMRTDPS